jgi:hypothetical protein
MRERLGSFIRHNAVALVALVVAMSGVAYAAAPKNSVTSKSIKDGNVKTADLAAAAVTSTQIADGSIGLADLSAAAAAPGNSGVHTEFGFNSNSTAVASASCPAGEVALGGGGQPAVTDPPVGALKVSIPTGSTITGGVPTGWTVRYENATASPGIGVWVICMPA